MCHLYLLFQHCEPYVYLHPVSRCKSWSRRYQHFHLFWFHHGGDPILQRNVNSFFLFICQTELIAPTRHSSVDNELIDRTNCLKQKCRVPRISIEVTCTFCFKIPRLRALVPLKTGWPVSLNRCIILLDVRSHCPF